jgi:hypothetical protein
VDEANESANKWPLPPVLPFVDARNQPTLKKRSTSVASALENHESLSEAFRAGRRVGLAISALALSLVAFLSLLGMEKAILAIILGAMALRGSAPGTPSRRYGLAAIVIGSLFLVTAAVVLVAYWNKIGEIIVMLNQLS